MKSDEILPSPTALFEQLSQVTGGFLHQAEKVTSELIAKFSPDIQSIHTKQEADLLTVEMALPGYGKDEVSVEADGGTLIISVTQPKDNKLSFYATEGFVREIPMPKGARADKMNAKFTNGVLRITVPVSGTPAVRVTVT